MNFQISNNNLNSKELQRIKDLKIHLTKAADAIISKNGRLDAQKVLKILQMIIGNIAAFPTDPKYRKIKSRNKLVSSVFIIEGFRDFLVLCGGNIKVVDFEENWIFESSLKLNEMITLAAPILTEYAKKIEDLIERETRKSDQKQIEQEIRETTARKFRDDRSIIEDRIERERLNQMIREQRKAQGEDAADVNGSRTS